MNITVTLSVTIDPAVWRLNYGDGSDQDIENDVALSLREQAEGYLERLGLLADQALVACRGQHP